MLKKMLTANHISQALFGAIYIYIEIYHIQEKLSEDVFISRRFFPYRKNKPILNLPAFPLELNDNANKTLERLKNISIRSNKCKP